MNWKISYIFFGFILLACTNIETNDKTSLSNNYLIEVDELKRIYDQPNIKIIDYRKNEVYKQAHIKGAINIWRPDIEDINYPYGGMIASKHQIETLFSRMGISNSDTLIIYDDIGLCDAARLWWVLQNFNFDNVKLLHGGFKGWIEKDGVISNEITKFNQTNFAFTHKPSMKYNISKNEVLNNLTNQTLVLDTRTPEEFTGQMQKKGSFKAGRLPNSINIDWSSTINYNGNLKFKSIEDLENIYMALEVSKDDPIIVYCHSGVRSAHTTFVLTQLLGFRNVKNYDGSWTEWSYFDELPYEKDNITN